MMSETEPILLIESKSNEIYENRTILDIMNHGRRESLMTVTATEFKTNLGKYLDAVAEEDVFITKNGKIVAQLTRPQNRKLAALRSLVGIASTGEDVDEDQLREKRLKRQ